MLSVNFYKKVPGCAYHLNQLAERFAAEDRIHSTECRIYEQLDPALYALMEQLLDTFRDCNCIVNHGQDGCMGCCYSIRTNGLSFARVLKY